MGFLNLRAPCSCTHAARPPPNKEARVVSHAACCVRVCATSFFLITDKNKVCATSLLRRVCARLFVPWMSCVRFGFCCPPFPSSPCVCGHERHDGGGFGCCSPSGPGVFQWSKRLTTGGVRSGETGSPRGGRGSDLAPRRLPDLCLPKVAGAVIMWVDE